ncbi:DNA starvation/stationary phase protection protein [Paenibacillus sp. N1-5-1-14]|uniref:Dps family protein n=1 Tax=Paenibacillus radicibacter TaxID=2972488 RepID=UPI00215974A4|nr:Dps family protein [Paenibacillus radicibacter]MCR8641212.1 DNA starvation/stationary phase protection protein [Paenibacillus radicibacter]
MTTTLTTTKTLEQVLNTQIANWQVLYTKLHNYHWYVKGNQFFTLHEKFEELYNEAGTHVDELAERLLAIGGRPAATLAEYLKLSTIQEAGYELNANQMVASVVQDFKTIIGELSEGMEIAQEAGDDGTSDMLLEIKGGLDKHVWMLNAFLG